MLSNRSSTTQLIQILIILIISNIVNYSCGIGNSFSFIDTASNYDIIAGDVFFEIIDPEQLEYTYRLRPAKNFGAPFNSSFKLTNVALVLVQPPDGCTKIQNQYELLNNIALMTRGRCSFLYKTSNAEQSGARAVIITELNKNSPDFDHYIEMIHDTTDISATIPAGFMLGKNGRMIVDTLHRLNLKYAITNLPVNLTFTPAYMINHPPWTEF